jgi:protein SCO1
MADPFPELEEEQTPEERAAGLRTFRMIAWMLVALVAGIGLFALFGPDRHASPSEPVNYGDTVGGAFSLTAPDGSTVTDQTLLGKPFAIFFGFTRCPDVCPTTLSRMTQLRKRLGRDGGKFNIVFVSVDPEHDSPKNIGRYVNLFGTPIIGLTGTDEQLAQIAKAYHVFYEKVPVDGGDYTIDHTAAVYLMDRDGKLQSTLDYHEPPNTSLEKLKRLVG